jgi:hypothetical protein
MAATSQKIEFRGQWTHVAKRVLLYLVLISFSLSFILMAARALHLITFFWVISAPVILPYFIASLFLDRFSFNDGKETIARPLHRDIPYKKIRAIHLIERNGSLKVCAKHRWPWKTTLVRTLDISERRESLREELRKRFPQLKVYEKSSSDLRLLLGMVGAIVFMGILYHVYFYHRYPNLRTIPKELEATKPERAEKNQEVYSLKTFVFSLSKPFKEKKKGDDKVLLFGDKKSNSFVRVIYKSEKEKMSRGERLFYYATGMKDYFDLLAMIYQARMGIIPLALKAIILGDLTDLEIYNIKPDNLTGYIMRGKTEKETIAHVLLRDSREKAKINFFFASPNPIPLKTIKSTADSVRTNN